MSDALLAVDELAEAVEYMRERLKRDAPIGVRARLLWAGVVAARDLGASDVIRDAFVRLANETGITAQLPGRREDVEHLIAWGQRNRSPFGASR